MFLAVIAQPNEEHDFDGKIFIKRVAREEEYKKTVFNQNFTDDATMNGLIKDGEWKHLPNGECSLGDLKDAVAEHFFLDDDIKERLVIRYRVPGREEGSHKNKYIEDDDDLIPYGDSLDAGDYTLMVKYRGKNARLGIEGEKREVDVSCDSRFMTEVMPKVGKAIRDAYDWVDRDHPIFLFLDNAGGHRTQAAVDAYVKMLEEDWNVICIHQRPRSPATNMLDLGVWMALQSVVETLHFRKRMQLGALAETVEEAWDKLEPIKLENVYNRWKMVLDLIIEDEGGNAKVETKRGKLFREPSREAECLGDDDETTEEDEIAEADADTNE